MIYCKINNWWPKCPLLKSLYAYYLGGRIFSRRNSQNHPSTIAQGSISSLDFKNVHFSPWTMLNRSISSSWWCGVPPWAAKSVPSHHIMGNTVSTSSQLNSDSLTAPGPEIPIAILHLLPIKNKFPIEMKSNGQYLIISHVNSALQIQFRGQIPSYDDWALTWRSTMARHVVTRTTLTCLA